jgi:hypothetical protein
MDSHLLAQSVECLGHGRIVVGSDTGRDLSFFQSVPTGSGVQPTSQLIGIGVLFPDVKRTRHDAEYSFLAPALDGAESALHSLIRLHGQV